MRSSVQRDDWKAGKLEGWKRQSFPNGDRAANPPSSQLSNPIRRPSFLNWRTIWVLLFLTAVIWALARAGFFERDLINQGGWTLAARFVRAGLHPDLSPYFLRLTLDATITTLAFAVCGTCLALLFGFVGQIKSFQVLKF